MEHGIAETDNYQMPEGLWTKTRNLILVVGVIAWALTLIGAFVSPKQFFSPISPRSGIAPSSP